MAQSYSGNPASSDRDKVRFLARDTATNAMALQDEEIDWLLTTEANVWMAAAAAVELVANRNVGVTSKSVGGLSLSFSPQAAADFAKQLRLRGRGYQVPTAGGLSTSEKTLTTTDTDLPAPDFHRGLHDYPGL